MNLRRLGKILALVLGLAAAPLVGEAQQPGKVPRIGYLILSPLADPPSAERQAFLDGLRDRGYVVGRNISIEYRSANWNRELLPDLAEELVGLKVDVIVAVPGAIEAARDATKTIPIVLTSGNSRKLFPKSLVSRCSGIRLPRPHHSSGARPRPRPASSE